jgi:glycosyltransferase involved in cell wall biosynthesis
MISICIPTYEMNGKGVEYLEYSFNILYHQTFKNFEVVISDHSKTDLIKDLCNKWGSILNINYVKNEYKRGNSSANINNTIKNAKGDIIKILCQDDFLYDMYSLENQISQFDKGWLITACCHYNGSELYRPLYPQYHDNIQYGENTIGSPSVLMFENKDIIEFDENLIWLTDVDYYKRLYIKFGPPTICNDISVVSREHPDQVTHTLATDNIKQQEYNYIIKKYETTNTTS